MYTVKVKTLTVKYGVYTTSPLFKFVTASGKFQVAKARNNNYSKKNSNFREILQLCRRSWFLSRNLSLEWNDYVTSHKNDGVVLETNPVLSFRPCDRVDSW